MARWKCSLRRGLGAATFAFGLLLAAACGPTLTTHRVAPDTRIEQIALSIANVFALVGPGGVVLVDAGGEGDEEDILEALAELAIPRASVKLIVITHAHADHAGSGRALARALGVPVAIQRADAAQVALGVNPDLKPRGFTAVVLGWFLDDDYPAYTPNLAFDKCLDLAPFGVPALVRSTPGHTPGSSMVFVDGGHVLVGDLLLGGFLGGAIAPHNPEEHYYQEDPGQVRALISWLANLEGLQRLYPGHGGPVDLARVREALIEGEFGDPPKNATPWAPAECTSEPPVAP